MRWSRREQPLHLQLVGSVSRMPRRHMLEALVRAEGNGWLLPRLHHQSVGNDTWAMIDRDDVR